MPASQLKRLKASLREQGILGPQQSKKQKRQNARNGVNKERKVSRNTALVGIREQFNPFEFKELARKPKFEATAENSARKNVRRPGLQKSLEEEARREAYIEEQQRRRKVGGILDRRFGENDPGMAPEEKMLERFTREKQLRHKNNSAFDLEDEETPDQLTHMGQSLLLDGPALKDDFDEDDLQLSDAADATTDDDRQALKRRHSDLEEDGEVDQEEPSKRKKSKQEVMKEVIAKSKLHKYERQAAKDDDDDLREELDKEMADIHGLLRGIPSKSMPSMILEASMNPDRAALLNGLDKAKFDREYDLRMRQLARDAKSKPTEKSRTEEEIAIEKAQMLQELESRRLRRMEGSSVDNDDKTDAKDQDEQDAEEEDYGFGAGIKVRPSNSGLGLDDEDDFLIDDDLVASASGSELSEDDSDTSNDKAEVSDQEDDAFVKDLLSAEDSKRPEFLTGANARAAEIDLPAGNGVNGNLAYSFPCPQSHDELLAITRNVDVQDLPIVVQRIRALYHPKLKGENKSKLGNFAIALVDHIRYLANHTKTPAYAVIENLIRHIHSLAKLFPIEIANTFRRHLKEMDDQRALSLDNGDLVLFTAIGTIFPTSDHFHQVVTPAILSMARYLGLKIPHSLSSYTTGAFICTMCLHYQRLSKRYMPEAMNFINSTLCVLAPTKLSNLPGNFPCHEPKPSCRILKLDNSNPRTLKLADCNSQDTSGDEQEVLKASLLETMLLLLSAAADIYVGKAAFHEVFKPSLLICEHLRSAKCRAKLSSSTQKTLTKIVQKLTLLLQQAQLARRPLELHHHRPLAIKTSIPKFEENFNPERHYDPDKTRTESAKLKKEHKRERKGAIRELRKDAHILATQSLKEKKERDAAYEKKYKRLVAEIQGEEGREAKAYEREKEWRKKGKR